MPPIPLHIRQTIIVQADHRCEYCQTSHRLIGMPPIIDHIIPLALGGTDDRSNLAAACYRCNEFKGIKASAKDPATGQWVALFHPRQQLWRDHFQWGNAGTHILGLTPTGRATVLALRFSRVG